MQFGLLGSQFRYLMLLIIITLGGLLTYSLSHPSPSTQPIIIDTDMGGDDWLAILYLAKHPNIDIKAIMLDGNGEALLEPARENVIRLLSLVNYQKPLLLGLGATQTLIGNRTFPSDFRITKSTLLSIKPTYNKATVMSANHAYETVLKNVKQPVTILAIGPLTTLANALAVHPELKKSIKKLIILGGAIHVNGNVLGLVPTSQNNVAEWNLYIDPIAANQVFQSGIPITLVPLDATNQVPLTPEFAGRFTQQRPIVNFLKGILTFKHIGHYLWDPLASSLLVNPHYGQSQRLTIAVNTNLKPKKSGQTYRSKNGTEMDVFLQVNRDAFESNFVKIVSN